MSVPTPKLTVNCTDFLKKFNCRFNCCNTTQKIVVYDTATKTLVDLPKNNKKNSCQYADNAEARRQFDTLLQFYQKATARDATKASENKREDDATWDQRIVDNEPLTRKEIERLLSACESDLCPKNGIPKILMLPKVKLNQDNKRDSRINKLVSDALKTKKPQISYI